MRSRLRLRAAVSVSAVIVMLLGQFAGAQTKVKPGVNLYSIKQDIEIGQRASVALERQMPMVNDPQVQEWIDQLGHKLAASTTKPDLPWRFRVINSGELNAFSLPGGFVYVNKGLILFTDNESEVAAALAHEMAHVTLRHATNQLSKGMLLGGPFALGGPVGVAGYSLAFMRFSRTDETQADIVGTQTMVQAGYDPQGMVTLFQKLEKRGPNCCGPEYLSDHGNLGDRIKRVQKEIGYLRVAPSPLQTSQQYIDAKARLQAIAPPREPAPAPPVAGGYPRGYPGQQPGYPPPPGYPQPGYPPQGNPPSGNQQPGYPPARPGEGPSTGSEVYRSEDGFYEVEYPSNWRPWAPHGRDVIITAPRAFNRAGGEVNLGVVIGYFDMQVDPQGQNNLDLATDAAIKRVISDRNSYLSEEPNARSQGTLSGRDALGTYLVGRNRAGENERDWLIVGPGGRGFVYLLFVCSDRDFQQNQPTFESIIESFRLNDGHFGVPRPGPNDRPEPPNPNDRDN
jgi:hypothetical protein